MSGRCALIVATDTYEDPKLHRLRTPQLAACAVIALAVALARLRVTRATPR